MIRVVADGICRGGVELFNREHGTPSRFGHEPVRQVLSRGPWVKSPSEGDWVVGCIGGSFSAHAPAREKDAFPVAARLGEAACLPGGGDFGADLILSDSTPRKTLRSASIAGILSDSCWSINGNVGSVSVGRWGAASMLAAGGRRGLSVTAPDAPGSLLLRCSRIR